MKVGAHIEERRNTEFDAAEWVDRYGDYLYGYALSRVRNEWLAEDLVQEALMAGIKGYHAFNRTSSEKTWLCGILKHKIIDHFRKTGREAVFSDIGGDRAIDDMFTTEGKFTGHWTAESRPAEWPLNPEKTLETEEFREALNRCIGGLPDLTANVFVLRELEGMDCDEICDILQISQSNCWVLLHRSRMRLRKCLEKNWFRKEN